MMSWWRFRNSKAVTASNSCVWKSQTGMEQSHFFDTMVTVMGNAFTLLFDLFNKISLVNENLLSF